MAAGMGFQCGNTGLTRRLINRNQMRCDANRAKPPVKLSVIVRRQMLAVGENLRMLPFVRIVIVEDHAMFREVLRKVCARDLRHEVVGEASDGQGAVQLVRDSAPDMVLLDLHLPKLDGFGVAEAIRQASPNIKILILSSHCDDYTVFRAEKTRVNGFVDKNTNTVAILKEAITAVGNGLHLFFPGVPAAESGAS